MKRFVLLALLATLLLPATALGQETGKEYPRPLRSWFRYLNEMGSTMPMLFVDETTIFSDTHSVLYNKGRYVYMLMANEEMVQRFLDTTAKHLNLPPYKGEYSLEDPLTYFHTLEAVNNLFHVSFAQHAVVPIFHVDKEARAIFVALSVPCADRELTEEEMGRTYMTVAQSLVDLTREILLLANPRK